MDKGAYEPPNSKGLGRQWHATVTAKESPEMNGVRQCERIRGRL